MKQFKHIGDLLLKKRIAASFTQRDVARIIDVHPQLISNIERHVSSIPPERQKKVCQILKITKHELFHAKKLDFVESFEETFNNEWEETTSKIVKPKKQKGRPANNNRTAKARNLGKPRRKPK